MKAHVWKNHAGQIIARSRASSTGRDMISVGMREGLRAADEFRPEDLRLVPACFSLTCTECDAGDSVRSRVRARKLGWTGVFFEPTGPSWNYLGLCPKCRREEQKDGAK